MKRRRFTVRFSDEEFQALEAFANREHVIHSVAVRWLIGIALANRCPKSGRTLNCQEGPKPHHCWNNPSRRPPSTSSWRRYSSRHESTCNVSGNLLLAKADKVFWFRHLAGPRTPSGGIHHRCVP